MFSLKKAQMISPKKAIIAILLWCFKHIGFGYHEKLNFQFLRFNIIFIYHQHSFSDFANYALFRHQKVSDYYPPDHNVAT